MKNSFFLFLFFLIINCSVTKKSELNIEDLKRDGVEILSNKKELNINLSDISKINKILLYSDNIGKIVNKNYQIINDLNIIKYFNTSKNFISLNNTSPKSIKNNLFHKNLIVHNSNLIFVDDEANLLIFNKNLNLIKKFTIHKKSFFSKYLLKFSLLEKNNTLYISDNLGSLIAFDLETNKILWRNNLDVPFFSNMAIYKDFIYMTNANGKLYSFRMKDGSQMWSYEVGTNIIKSNNAFEIEIFENFLIFSNDVGNIYLVDLEKRQVNWDFSNRFAIISGSDTIFFNLTNFIVEKNSLYFSTSFGNITKLNLTSGEQMWTSNFDSDLNLANSPNYLLIINKNGHFNIYDKNLGKLVFSKNLIKLLAQRGINSKKTELISLYLNSKNILIYTKDGFLFLINPNNLENVQYRKIADTIRSNIVYLEDSIFFIGEKNNIYKLN